MKKGVLLGISPALEKEASPTYTEAWGKGC